MSETKQIAEMASKVSDDLFEIFKWKRKIVEDNSWVCVTPEDHGDKTDHPSDCVFYYRDPYDNEMKYINTDLKSYKKSSITKDQIRNAIHSLSYATNCAAFNPHWKNLFKPEGNYTVHGMLFVYNHCGKYAGSFSEIVAGIDDEVNHLDSSGNIFICDPYQVTELHSIGNDIKVMIGTGLLPQKEEFCFFHPNEMMSKNHFDSGYDEPATIEVLSSPWVIVKHAKCLKSEAGYVIYYRRDGVEVDEFIYLLDALSYYQVLNNKANVRIKLTKANEFGALNLTTAIQRYFSDLGRNDEQIEAIIKSMVQGTIAKVQPQFSSVELGVLS